MKSRHILVALLALALQARADRVSRSEVAGAARVWAGVGSALGVNLGANVGAVREYAATNGYSFYVVRFGGGTMVMTSDTSLDPVVAFSPSGDLDFSAGSPLFKLMCKDIAARAAIAGGAPGARPSSLLTASSGSAASSLWSLLLRRPSASAPSARTSAAASEPPVSSVSDMRVAPLVKSKWDQGDAGGGHCYNYCTPDNLLCGCTATAMSQIMRYFEFPNASVAARTFDCEVNGEKRSLTMQGGVYDWAKMTLVPGSGASDASRREIGRLTSDTGIALKSSYTAAITTAFPMDVAAAFRDAFGYPDAICYWNEKDDNWSKGQGGLHTRSLRDRVIYANLDAGQPVQLAIYGYSAGHVGERAYWAGHSVVADGYGFMTVGGVETEYVHVNMGWAGTDDLWYNIPEINVADSGSHVGDKDYDFLYLGGATFNISTNDTGLSILSGRVTSEDGAAVAGARVGAFDEGGVCVGETETSESGVYFFKLPGGVRYSVAATTRDGRGAAELDFGVVLRATTGMDGSHVVTDSSNVGNSWGNDMTFEDAVGYYVDAAGRTNAAARIDSLAERYAAQLAAGELGASPRMVLRRSGALTRPIPVTNGLEISGDGVVVDLSGAPATVFPVTGGRLIVTGVTFTNFVGNAVFLVDDGATMRLGGGVRLADIEGTNYHSGAVAVLNGAATIGGGAVLDNCRAAIGGGVYVAAGRKLVLAYGCTITNCYAQTCGGGVYAGEKSAVYLASSIRIAGNGSQDPQEPVVDNMYLENPAPSKGVKVSLTDTVTGSIGIRWSDSNDAGGNSPGKLVASADSAAIAHDSAEAFFSDVEASLVAEAADSPPRLVWADASPGPHPSPTPSEDGAKPLPIAFSAIVADAGGAKWTLSVTTVVEKCWYSLYETGSIATGFSVDGLEPVERRQADSGDVPTMTFTRQANGSQLFWKVVAEPEKPN